MKAYTDRIAAEAPAIEAEWADLVKEWHCPGRHGVIRDVPSAKAGRVQRVIEWYMGANACRWTSAVNGRRSVEFVAMTKVYPPPRKPWEWCGTTVLFGDWQDRERAEKVAAAEFRLGQKVWFSHHGVLKVGIVAGINRRTVSVVVDGARWTVPPSDLNVAEG
jgi:hypothetical protein